MRRHGLRIVIEGRDDPLPSERAVDMILAVVAVLRHFLGDVSVRLERDLR